MNRILTLLCSFLFLSSYPQNAGETMPFKTDTIGTWVESGAPITANTMSFEKAVYGVQLTDSLPYILAIIRDTTINGEYFKGKGWVIGVEKESGKVLFNRKLDLNWKSFVLLVDKFVIRNDRKSTVYSAINGEELTTIKSDMPVISYNNNIGVGYDRKSIQFTEFTADTLKAFNLDNGSVLWSTKIPHQFGWASHNIVGDSLLVIAADGLFGINTNNGDTWHIDVATGMYKWKLKPKKKLNYGFDTHGTKLDYGSVENVMLLGSNIEADTNNIYFASMTAVIKSDLLGNIIWRKQLPNDSKGRSAIVLEGSRLLFVNFGYGLTGVDNFTVGIPSVASFDTESGELIYFRKLEEKITKELYEFYSGEKYVYALNDHILKCFDKLTGDQLGEIEFSKKNIQRSFARRNDYIQLGNEIFHPLNPNPDSVICILEVPRMEKPQFVRYSVPELNYVHSFDPKEKYNNNGHFRNLTAISKVNDHPNYILDERNSIAASIDLDWLTLYENSAYSIGVKENKLFIIQSDQLLNEEIHQED